MILLTPDGETMLVDGGYPTPDDRDTKRIVAVAQAVGIKQFDLILATHYDADHVGNIPRVDTLIPGKVFVDHGEPIPTLNAGSRRANYEPYVKAIGDRKRISIKPGDVLPIKGLRITVVTAGGKAISQPLPGGGQPNDLSPASRPTYTDSDDNAGSSACSTSSASSACSIWPICSRRSSTTWCAPEPHRHRGPVHGEPSRPEGVERQVPGACPASQGGHHEQRAPQRRRPRNAGRPEELPRACRTFGSCTIPTRAAKRTPRRTSSPI